MISTRETGKGESAGGQGTDGGGFESRVYRSVTVTETPVLTLRRYWASGVRFEFAHLSTNPGA